MFVNHMKTFGFDTTSSTSLLWKWLDKSNPVFVFLLFLWYPLFSVLALVFTVVEDPSKHVHTNTMQRIATYISPIFPDISEALYNVQQVSSSIIADEPLFPQHTTHIDELLLFLQKEPSFFSFVLGNNQLLIDILSQLANYRDDIFSLLWSQEPQTYLIVLQNTSEKRPNGWFFWSFWLLTLDKGRVEDFTIHDSYLPGFDKPGTYVTWPSRLTNFLPEREIYFIGANKIWFTYHDGAYIKTLYEKSYPWSSIRGVVFVSTDVFREILPAFQKEMWTWQFVNASIDLIRGGRQRWKKELYVSGVSEFLWEHSLQMLKGFFLHAQEIISRQYINLYLSDISGSMHTFLRDHHLTTRFEDDHMYFWDSNISFSKVDSFVSKTIQFRDQQGNLVLETTHDIVSIANLPPWPYTVSIRYNLHVPEHYVSYIRELEKEYEIELTEREIHILALVPRRATRWVVYMPPHTQIWSVNGDQYHNARFTTPFSTNIYYKAKMLENNMVKEVVMEIEIAEK